MIKLAPLLTLSLLLSGCLNVPQEPMELPGMEEQAFSLPEPKGGSLFSERSLVLFEDLKARSVGDLLTVLLVEKTDASKKSSTKTSKESKVSNTTPSFLGRPITKGGAPILDGSIDSSTAFNGEGDSTQSNTLDGSLSVTVIKRYANGNLKIQGRKKIALNQGSEFVSLAGIVRPQDIGPNNTINSDRIAQAQITYSGKGPVNDANRMGFLTRFFNSPWWLQ